MIETGNVAEMRSALEEQLRYWNTHVRTRNEEDMRVRTEAALSAPPRNCDRFRTAEEAESAFVEFCARASSGKVPNWRCSITCGYIDPSDWVTCCIKWLFAPATEREGGNNEDN